MGTSDRKQAAGWSPFWKAPSRFETLSERVRVEVAVVGGGLTGLTVAKAIRNRGRPVALLERGTIAGGATGSTSGILTAQPGFCYDHVRTAFSPRQARVYATLLQAGIERVGADCAAEDGNRCGFEWRPSYVYANNRDRVEREVTAASAAGLSATFVTSVPPFERATSGIRVENQAVFDPGAYTNFLATELTARSGVELFEDTWVQTVKPGSPCILETPNGQVIADQVVIATGVPIIDPAAYFTRLHPTRSYLLAVRLGSRAPTGTYLSPTDGRTVRVVADEDPWPLLLVGGEEHKPGDGESAGDRYERLEHWTRERFSVREIEGRWSVQGYRTNDRLPFVGPIGGAPNVFVGTGFGNWGEAAAIAAGELLADALADTTPATAHRQAALKLLDPRRVTSKASAPTALEENADAASQFATGWVRSVLTPDRDSRTATDGQVRRVGRELIAVATDEQGERHAVSAVCPHRSCVLEWNDADRTWDCPCHGSRYAPDGTWLEGPANEDLPSRDLPEE